MKARTSFFILSAAVIVGIGVVYASSLAWVNDDAFISFRYAKNLVRGLGLVYNSGERVEGIRISSGR
jgi:arabinofuranosyltransferase